ncbi:MAG: hypothetical protein ABJA79_02745 [Parafilimonas sp.]
MAFINSMKNKSRALLRKAVLTFLNKSPRIVNMAHKVSGAMRKKEKEELFTRFFPNDFPKIFRHSSVSTNRKKYLITDSIIPAELEKSLGKLIRSLDEIPESDIPNSLFYIYFICDSDALPVLRKIIHSGGQILPPNNFYRDLRTS